MESELFGHRRGSFTGAVADRPGIVEAADGGTLFLDEVGNLPAAMQAKLLRFLNDRRYRRVGETRERSVDVRLVSASNRDLAALVSDGVFRDDLYYRLAVFALHIPSLAERREDIPPLVYHFIRRFNTDCGYAVEGVRQDALDLLVDAPWPCARRDWCNPQICRRRSGSGTASGPDDRSKTSSASTSCSSSRTVVATARGWRGFSASAGERCIASFGSTGSTAAAEDLSKQYSERQLLAGVNLQINRGDRIGLIGIDGSG